MGGVEKHRFVSYLLDVQLGEEDVSKCGCTGALASVCKGKEFILIMPVYTELAQPAGARIVVAVQPDLQLYTDSCSGFS